MSLQLHEMTASYSEISFDSQSSPPISELRSLIDSPDVDSGKFLDDNLEKIGGAGHRPDQLNLKSRGGSPTEDDDLDPPSYHKAIGYLQLEGRVMQDGDMVLFVTEDLENKIKLSSPVTKKGDTPSFPGSRSSTPCLYRQALTPQLPPLDHNVLNELEMEARKVATSVDALTENLAAILQNVSHRSDLELCRYRYGRAMYDSRSEIVFSTHVRYWLSGVGSHGRLLGNVQGRSVQDVRRRGSQYKVDVSANGQVRGTVQVDGIDLQAGGAGVSVPWTGCFSL